MTGRASRVFLLFYRNITNSIMDEKELKSVRIVLDGFTNVGKSSLMGKFTRDEFYENKRLTVGVNFETKLLPMKNCDQETRFLIWDWSRSQRFRIPVDSYYRGAQGAVLVYDVTSAESFRAIREYLAELELEPELVTVLVGNKADREADRRVPRGEGEKLARENNLMFMETSAKTGQGVQEMFEKVAEAVIKKQNWRHHTEIIQDFVGDVHKNAESSIDELSSNVQKFYLETSKRFSVLDDEDRARICDLTEKLVTESCYEQLFCHSRSKDAEEDIDIQLRIRRLGWVTTEHLKCPFSESAAGARDLMYDAITDLLLVDSCRAPQDKLARVVTCAKKIFSVIRTGQRSVVSADDLIPAMVFIILKANPPRLKSNINFITRFSAETRLTSGEAGYYFTSLCCALSFIEAATAASLGLDQEEFDGLMSGGGGVRRQSGLVLARAEVTAAAEVAADPLLVQIEIVTGYIAEARRLQRPDEVRMLEENLTMLREEHRMRVSQR